MPVHEDRPTFGTELMRAYSLVSLPVEAMNDTSSVRLGNTGQSVEELTANLGAVVDKVVKHVPGGEVNIRGCYIQLAGTDISLPIYVDFGGDLWAMNIRNEVILEPFLGSANEVKLEKAVKREYPATIDEISTLPDGLLVKVSDDGEVKVIDVNSKWLFVLAAPTNLY